MQRSTILTRLLGATALVAGAVAATAVATTPGSAAAGATVPGAARPGAVAPAAVTANWYGSAPYAMPLDNDPPDLRQVMAATGQRAFELAFILSSGGSCSPAWDGTHPVASDTQVAGVISAIRAGGGDVTVSTGGFNGTKLGQACPSPQATAAAYQQVVDRYALRAIDFDLEEPEIENATAIDNELVAAQTLQRDNPGMYVSVTIPSIGSGANFFGQQLLNKARGLGFAPANYSIMPFDGGFNGGAAQIAALEAFHGQLMTTFGWSSAVAYAHEGVSLMNGRSDIGEIFTTADFQAVLDYATGHGLSRYTFWSVNRDRQCTPPNGNGTTSGTCSSVAQSNWAFTALTTRFAGLTPPTAPAPPPTPEPGSCPAPWVSTTAYVGGSSVSFGGHAWVAKWWTQGDQPGHNAQDVWTDQGPCR